MSDNGTGGGPPPPSPAALRASAEAMQDEFVAELRSLVDIDCGSYTPSGVNLVADIVQAKFQGLGWSVRRHPHHPDPEAREPLPQLGDLLVATLSGSRPATQGGARVLLVGHMDTVFGEGTAGERPFRIDGTTATGPGVSDMKGGLLTGIYAVMCLQRNDFDAFDSITYVCNPDEEIGSPFSGPAILERAATVDACFVLEGARANGDIVSARKGVAELQVIVQGRSAHAGVEPEKGRSATLQAAHTTIALHELNGRWPGVTVNVGVVEGGTRPNVVAERCELHVDLRAVTAEAFDQAVAEAERVASTTTVPDTSVEIRRAAGFPPMEKTPGTARLADRAREIAGELGFELHDAATGGASDANPVAGIGIPVLDGLGPIGGDDHAPSEWLDLASVPPRVALLASLIASVGPA
ncbi:MAG TPA: M20 family metallopeptidase [Actinomycetota bacterium]